MEKLISRAKRYKIFIDAVSKNLQGKALDKEIKQKAEQMGDEINNGNKNYSHWAKRKDRFYPTLVTHETLPSDVYESKEDSDSNYYFKRISFPSDELLNIPGTPVSYVLNEIEKFWGREKFFTDLGLVYKRGVMFYGPAGCGKTSIIRMIATEIVRREGIVLSITDIERDQDLLLKMREFEPKRSVLCIFEDIEKFTEQKNVESDLLSFLDGEKQIGNVIYMATTNKPDTLEDRLLKRPGRFDLVVGLNPPVEEARFLYLQRLFVGYRTDAEIRHYAKKTNGLGMAHLRELVVSMVAFERGFDETVARMRGNIKKTYKMSQVGDNSQATGFTVGFVGDQNKKFEDE